METPAPTVDPQADPRAANTTAGGRGRHAASTHPAATGSEAGHPVAGGPARRATRVLVVAAWIVAGVVLVAVTIALGRSSGGLPPLEVAPGGPGPAAAPPVADPGAEGAATLSGPAGVSMQWAEGLGERLDIAPRALAAYAGAALRLDAELPECRLGWTTLAAIGAIESAHGTHGGAIVGADGRASPPILGVPLDGDGVAAISDTDGGELDGDTRWDRAVGPMQFIPSTWARWAADGNDDGRADPHTIDDAALAAGRYLCASGGDLSQAGDWRSAVLTYNRSGEYADTVLSTANGYARASWD